jgi:putative zinc finger/helix-turn-helix YgiT family protein
MNDICMMCGEGQMELVGTATVDYRSLPGARLHGVEVWCCNECGEEEHGIPRINELQRTLARLVAQKPGRLAPYEIVFLRKQLGWSGVDFARYFGTTAETVCRWEKGRMKMHPAADRLLRICATRLDPIDNYDSLESLLGKATQDELPVEIAARNEGGRWLAA